MHKDPISPIDFISPLAKNNVLLRSDEVVKLPVKHNNLVATLKEREKILERIQQDWQTSHLLGLREKFQADHGGKRLNKIKLHDVVLVKNPLKARIFRSLGEIIEICPSASGLIRVVKVKKGDCTIKKYHVSNFYSLELTTQSLANEGNTAEQQ